MAETALNLLTVAQVAAELDRPVRTIHRWIKTGEIEAVKLGDGQTSAYVITREELDRFAAQPRPASYSSVKRWLAEDPEHLAAVESLMAQSEEASA